MPKQEEHIDLKAKGTVFTWEKFPVFDQGVKQTHLEHLYLKWDNYTHKPESFAMRLNESFLMYSLINLN
jgi:hypothetical protein